MKLLMLIGVGGLEMIVAGLPIAILIFFLVGRFLKKRFNSGWDLKVIAISAVATVFLTPLVLMVLGIIIGLVASMLS